LLDRRAEVGQRVKAGDVLARLDPEDFRLSQQAARAAVQAAQVNQDLSQADYKRFKDLRDQGFISSAELDRREAALKSAAAQLDQARAQAAVQGNQAAYATLVAPGSGVVLAVEAEPGTVLAAGSPVVRLAIDVPEDAASAVRQWTGRVGAVAVKLWGQEATLRATVREVAAVADPATRTFLVKADLSSLALQLGQTATVLFELPRGEVVTLLPLSAVKEHQGRSSVWGYDSARQVVVTREIELAGAQGNEVIVKQGLKPGERVVTAGVHVLTEGQKVRLAALPGPTASTVAAASAATR
jgi:membrane fusion protein, multidrug efflux system